MGEELIATLRELLDELVNVGNAGIADELFDPKFISHTSSDDLDLSGFKEFAGKWYRGFPDRDFSLEDIVTDGNVVSWKIRFIGKHKGEFLGIQPTGKSIDISMVNRMRIVDGRIAEHWFGIDLEAFTQQLTVP